jgi:hypothetical protein
MASKHTGAAEHMKPGGADESSVKRQNAPLRDLVENGHDLNHSFKNPAASIALDVKAAGTNHSYLHPHSGGPFPSGAMEKANAIKPMVQMGTGKK